MQLRSYTRKRFLKTEHISYNSVAMRFYFPFSYSLQLYSVNSWVKWLAFWYPKRLKKHFTFIYEIQSFSAKQSNYHPENKEQSIILDIYFQCWTWKGIISHKENPITGINKSSDRSLRSAIFINIVLYRSPYFSLGYGFLATVGWPE